MLCGTLAAPAYAQREPPAAQRQEPATGTAPALAPEAIALLKAMSARLADARSMTFTAVVTYESPSFAGPALAYTTRSDVTVRRPDKLRVITSGDGAPTEFYYDGTTMMAYAPADDLVAIAAAPPTIDGALAAAYDSAAIYFPFDDLIVADPYGDIADRLQLAFVIGRSHVVGGTTTDVIAVATDRVFAQIWIGKDDKLPRMMRAVYAADPLRLRHQVELSNWHLNGKVATAAFTSPRATRATRIEFGRPDPQGPPEAGASAPSGQPGER